MNQEPLNVQPGFRKGRWTGDQIANTHLIIENEREFQKNIYLFFIDYAKASACVDNNNLWEILKEMDIPDYLTYLLWKLYADQDLIIKLDREQWTGSNLEKDYIKAAYCHPAYLTYM